jgi:hypothetical protein
MKIHHFDVEFADKNGLSGVKEFVSALIIACIGTIVPAVLVPLGIISYVVMFLIMVVTVIIVAILIKKYGVINKSTMSVLIEDNEELYYLMITPDFHSATVPKDLTSLIAGPTAVFIENKMEEEIKAMNIAQDDQIVEELFNLYKNGKIKTNFDTIMYGKPIYVSKILEKDFKSSYKKIYKVKCIKDNKKQGKVVIPRAFPSFFNN